MRTRLLLQGASKYSKGTRLVVSIDNQAYIGTVTITKQGEVFIVLDNGEKVKLKEKSKFILGQGVNKKIKKAIPLNEISKYLIVSENKSGKALTNKREEVDEEVREDIEYIIQDAYNLLEDVLSEYEDNPEGLYKSEARELDKIVSSLKKLLNKLYK